ncbi:hypothetical protein A2U01_0042806, partial [Trifolium medium]|nr:hypothetical protein [Trifolium medium]
KDSEMQSIEANDTWELTTLPQGIKAIDVKWIFKTKYNEKGNVEKYKARLVAKGYTQKYASEILTRFGMEDCNSVCSPIVPGNKLVKDEKGKAADTTVYKKMIGCLMYLLSTRPDITFSVCLAARYMTKALKLESFCKLREELGICDV